MIVVTGGAGFIGSNVVEGLNDLGLSDILVVDDLEEGQKFSNLVGLKFSDYLDKREFIGRIESSSNTPQIDAVFHLGACSSTTEWDGRFMMETNYEYSKRLLTYCQTKEVPFIYASSASVYGAAQTNFIESREYEKPINVYAFSKFLFDQYVRGKAGTLTAQVVGLRYFNVFGPREQHKGHMISTANLFDKQIKEIGKCRLFGEYDGFAAGEQKRDFIFVEDCVDVNMFFYQNPDKSGIFNVGTGVASSFNSMAQEVLDWHRSQRGINGEIEYIPFPEQFKGAYQSFTQADIGGLREAGYQKPFQPLSSSVPKYLHWLAD